MPQLHRMLIEFRDLFTAHPLFLVGLLLLAGYLAGKLAARLHLPEITGFILAGTLVSSFTTGVVSHEMNASLHIVTEVAIGFLALTIGGEFSSRKIKRIGKDVVSITLIHLLGTFGVVLLGCVALNMVLPALRIGYPYAILLAVIACATSPAMIIAEVHHLRAHGRFVDYLFGVVAFGDALTVVVFGMAFSMVTNLLGTPDSFALQGQAIREIALSVACGILGAIPLAAVARRIRNTNEMMIVTIGIVFALTGVSLALHLSPLLVNMAMGAVLINFSSNNHRVFRSLEPVTPPIYALFFVIAGLEIDPSVFLQGPALLAGACYILLRGAGKCWSAAIACRVRKLPHVIGRNLGMSMLSQGGVALGFVLLIQTSPALDALRENAQIYAILSGLVNVVLLSIFVNELASPFFLRYAVMRGNEMEEA